MPSVSIVVPNYNHARFLRQRIDSILAQTYQDFELILLDDCSADDSRDVLRSYAADPRVAHVDLNEKNSGSPFAQWNKGVRLARGKYVWIAESDDYADPRFLERLVNVLEADPGIVIAYSRSLCVTPEGRLTCFADRYLSRWNAEQWTSDFCMDGREMCEKYFCRANPVPNASAVVFRKGAYEQAGGPDEGMRLCGDWKLWAGMALQGKVAFLCEPLNCFRSHDESVRTRTELAKADVTEYLHVSLWVLERVHLPEAGLEDIRADMADLWVPGLMTLRLPLSAKRTIVRQVMALDPRPLHRALAPVLRVVRLKIGRHWRELRSMLAARTAL